MPLLMCPNCQVGMKEINRENVMIDMCPECHGVWLDRGEIQKLLESAKQDAPMAAASAPYPQQQQQQPIRRDYDDRDRGYREPHYHSDHDRHYRKKSKLESIFDIFD